MPAEGRPAAVAVGGCSDTPAAELRAVLTATDCLDIGSDGTLLIDGCRADALAEVAGTPVYILAETTLRANVRRFTRAFAEAWPGAVSVLNSVKANANVAVQIVAREEGCGSDCSSLGELELARMAESPSRLTTLNGCNKQEAEIACAIRLGGTIVADAVEEIDVVEAIAARLNKVARLLIRLRPADPAFFAGFQSDGYPYPGGYADPIRRKKWGVSHANAAQAIERIASSAALSLEGYHAHVGRLSRDPDLFRHNHGFLGGLIAALQRETGYWPAIVDIGGGWPRDRDPEARITDLNPHGIEAYARGSCAALAETLGKVRGARSWPELWIEPGRYLLGNAGLLLTRAGVVKRDGGRTWVNVDASGELMLLVQSYGARNHVTVATGMARPNAITADVVGPTCVAALFAADRALPAVGRGELIAVLDAGAYAESQASQFNSIPRPATLLVRDGEAEIIRHREGLEDMLRLQSVPPRLSRNSE